MNFKTADLELREKIARSALLLMEEAGLFFPHATIVLSTCNRCEIYFNASDLAEAHTDLLRFLRKELHVDVEQKLYSYFGIDCLAHLCRVASGLDSAIVAETEIQRQVKCAYLSAAKRRELPSGMHFLFQKALRVGKEVRTSLPMIRGGMTVFNVIWEEIRRIDLHSASILFVGHSRMNRELIFFLGKRGMRRAHLCTRYVGNELSEYLDSASVFGREALSDWGCYDLIFCASNSTEHLLSTKIQSSKRHMIFDLSVPRNVDPSLGEMPNVVLYNIEQLDCLAKEGCFHENGLLMHCEERVRAHAVRLCAIYRKKQSFCQRAYP